MHKVLNSRLKVRIEDYSDYKEFLQAVVEDNRHIKGYQTLLASAAGCHPSFISQVLNSPIHLTPDHGAMLSEFLQLTEVETHYFLALIQLSRAATPKLKQVLEKTLSEIRDEHFSLSNRLEQPALEDCTSSYYSSWIYSAVHILLSIPDFQSKEKVQKKLNLSEDLVSRVFSDLEQMKLIENAGNGKWQITNKSIHLPRTSPLLSAHLQNWRARALLSLAEGGNEKVHYSALHALSKKDSETLKKMVVSFIEESRAIVKPSPEETLVCVNLDFFPV